MSHTTTDPESRSRRTARARTRNGVRSPAEAFGLETRPRSRGRKLVIQSVGTAGLNAAMLFFNVGVALLLSRLLGPSGYGAYAFATGWALLLAVPATLGLSQLVVREIATYRVREDWSRVKGLLRWANRAVLAAGLAISLTVATTFYALDWPGPTFFTATIIALTLVPLVPLVAIRQSAIQGFGAVILSRTPETLVAPVVMIGLVLGVEAARSGGISANSAVATQVASAAVAAGVGVFLLRLVRPAPVLEAAALETSRVWMMAALPILLSTVIQAVNLQAGTILTGSIAGSEQAGIYNIASRAAMLLTFLLTAVAPSLLPAIAELNERGETVALQRLITKAARLVFLGSVPVAVGVIIFAHPILGLFGADFSAGADALRILCLGQLVLVSTGLAGATLIMVGEAGLATWAIASGTALGLLLSVALIPALGAEGAAIGSAVSMAFTNILMAYLLWRRRGISSVAFYLGRSGP